MVGNFIVYEIGGQLTNLDVRLEGLGFDYIGKWPIANLPHHLKELNDRA
jgi:hypothetical protein